MMEQKTVQSFKITNIRQLDHEGQVTETETPVTRQQLAKVLAETILGVDIEQFEDHWAGNPQIDINLFEEHDKPGQYRANVYKVETDDQDMMYQGDCIADFDIELFTDRNDDLLLQCDNLQMMLMPKDKYINDEAEAVDSQFGYYVPFEIMMKGDQAVYDYIKAHIDENFPGERPE